MDFEDVIETAGKAADIAGVLMIIAGALYLTALYTRRIVRRRPPPDDAYTAFRHGLGRVILLGLELLVAADIIRTVAVTPTFESVGVLAAIVLIRTFLSLSIELEIRGRFPWQQAPQPISTEDSRPRTADADLPRPSRPPGTAS